MDFKKLLLKNHIYTDGAMGTEIEKRIDTSCADSSTLVFTHPEVIEEISSSYVDAGSDIIYASTFSANPFKLQNTGKTVEETVEAAVAIAKRASKGKALVALDIGPLGKLLEPAGELEFDKAYECFAEIAKAGEKAGCELAVIETVTDLYEMKAALLAVKENTALPVICSMSFEESGRTFTGCSASEAVALIESLGADAIGVNCSTGPEELYPIVKEIMSLTTLPVSVKPNAGLPDPVSGAYGLDAEAFSSLMERFAALGVKLLGGCCGTTPEYIRKTVEKTANISASKPEVTPRCVVTSDTKTVEINEAKIIGERINPTGKKLFREALINNDFGYIAQRAAEQAQAGADILDINVGVPDVDEKTAMLKAVRAVQSVCDLPLQIDSSDPAVIEAALRICKGKPIVNSVNGKEESLSSVLPLVKKYGASVVALTLDENGIPESADERCAIAEKIVNRAESVGISRKDIFVDCLTMTCAADKNAASVTLEALKKVKEKLGVKTVLGVSNISFGLPERECLNRTFLAAALNAGLDLAIINPNVTSMIDTVRAHRVLSGTDEGALRYISTRSDSNAVSVQKNETTLKYAVVSGLKDEAVRITKVLLEMCDAMDVVNQHLIPALDEVGDKFEKGIIFLPQLMISADTASACFSFIREKIASASDSADDGKKVVVATVKGDVHDIGKNIVKVLLESYGYCVIDLGKDVPPEAVVEAVRKSGARLVGLSALMTTTLPAMEETVAMLKREVPDVSTVVGGAVVNGEYAKRIGATYYAKDAKDSVDAAKQVYKQ